MGPASNFARAYDALLGLVCIGAGVALISGAINPALKRDNRSEVPTDETGETDRQSDPESA